MNEEEHIDPNAPKGISHHPLYKPALIAYWITASATILKILGAFVGFWDQAPFWLILTAFGPAILFFFIAVFEEALESAVYNGTKKAVEEILESLDDLPTEEDSERIAALYNSEPAGRA